MSDWKMPRDFPAEVRARKDGRFDMRVGARHILLTRRELECICADALVLLKEGERGL